ncbi:MAG: hypothetical protein NT157_03660 [Candidatus Micrarchaeota archaeon]|nr:hypothetical protein [Candidatus Micrarchaeota archaeon]
MVSLDKILHLAEGSCFDSVGNPDIGEQARPGGREFGPKPASGQGLLGGVDLAKVQALGAGTKYDSCTSSSCTRSVGGDGRIGMIARAGIERSCERTNLKDFG